jgi:peptidoglycan/xylan/chitin deacetylase (PgdA/CDA1 family)
VISPWNRFTSLAQSVSRFGWSGTLLRADYTGGIWRLYQLLEELNFTFSLIACGRSAELAPAVVTEAVNMGAEIVASGYRYVLSRDLCVYGC